jgi:SAM-dependent methyltransferase
MKHGVCPWWLGYLLASPLRRLLQDPAKLLAPYIREGMTVLEPGPGMGFFTLELARFVGAGGRVIAVDVQPKMLERLKRRADAAGVSDRVDARACSSDSLGLADVAGSVDFTLAFAVVHEMPSAATFFAEAAGASKAGASLLFAEPAGHINSEQFESELATAFQTGFALLDRPTIRRSRAALLKKL